MQVCSSYWSQFRGLMFSSKKNLLFVFKDEQRRNFHNFFVFFPIDLIFLNKDKKVVEIKKDFMPFTLYNSKEKAQYVIESADKTKYKINEKIRI